MNRRNIQVILIAYGAVAMFISGMVGPVMPVYLHNIGFDSSQIGSLIGLSGFTSALMSLFFGKIADRVDRRGLFIVSGAVMMVVPIGYIVWHTGAGLTVLRLLAGVGGPLASVTSQAMLLDSFRDDDKRGRALGNASTLRSLAYVIGPAAGGLVVVLLSVQGVFLADAIILGGSAMMVAWVSREVPRITPTKAPLFSLPSFVKSWVVAALLGMMLLDFMNFQTLVVVFPLYASKLDVSYGMVGLLITVESIAYAALQYPIGKLTDAGKALPLLIASVIIHGPLIWSLTLFRGFVAWAIIMALIGIASAPAFLVVMLTISKAAGEHTGMAMGLIGAVMYLATALGPMLAGMMGFTAPLLTSVVSLPLAVVVYQWYRRDARARRLSVIAQ